MELLSLPPYITESHLQQNVFGHLSCVHRLWKALALLGTQHGRSSAGDTEMYFARLSEQPHTLIHLQKHNCAWGKWSAAMFLSGLQRKPKVVLVTHVMELTHNGRICHPDTPCFLTLSLPVQGNAPLQSPHNPFLPSSNTTLTQVSLSSVTAHHRTEPQELLHTHVQDDSHSSRHPYLQSQVTRSPRIAQELYTEPWDSPETAVWQRHVLNATQLSINLKLQKWKIRLSIFYHNKEKLEHLS